MGGFLLGGLYDVQHTYSMFSSFRHASASPLAPIGLAVMLVVVLTIFVRYEAPTPFSLIRSAPCM